MGYGVDSRGNGGGRIYLERREDGNGLLFAKIGILIAINRSYPEDSTKFISPLIEFLN